MYGVALVLIALLLFGLQFLLKVRALGAARNCRSVTLAADRYRPMLRLLAHDDLDFVGADHRLRSALRARRRALFRGYLRCLTRDYSELLAGIRKAMVDSGTDRPDLARTLARNRVLFAWAICKVEYRLALHATGFGEVDISALITSIETLRNQVTALTVVPQPA